MAGGEGGQGPGPCPRAVLEERTGGGRGGLAENGLIKWSPIANLGLSHDGQFGVHGGGGSRGGVPPGTCLSGGGRGSRGGGCPQGLA